MSSTKPEALTAIQMEVLRRLKGQLEASRERPSLRADGTQDLGGYSVGGFYAPKHTVAALERRPVRAADLGDHIITFLPRR